MEEKLEIIKYLVRLGDHVILQENHTYRNPDCTTTNGTESNNNIK